MVLPNCLELTHIPRSFPGMLRCHSKFSSNFTPSLRPQARSLLPDFGMAEFCKNNLFSGVLSLSLFSYPHIPKHPTHTHIFLLVSHTSAHPYTLTCPHVHMAHIHPHVSNYFSPPQTYTHTSLHLQTPSHICTFSHHSIHTPHIYFPQRTYPDTCIPLYTPYPYPTSKQIFLTFHAYTHTHRFPPHHYICIYAHIHHTCPPHASLYPHNALYTKTHTLGPCCYCCCCCC